MIGKNALFVCRCEKIAQARVLHRREAFEQGDCQSGLADPGFARYKHDLAFAVLGPRPPPQQQFKFFFTPDQLDQPACVQRVEAALDRGRSQRHPGPHRTGDALQALRAKILKLKEVADELSGAFGNHDLVGLGNALQACGNVRRLANDRLLPGRIRSEQVANDDQPRSNADARLQGRHSLEAADRGDHFQPGANGAFRVILMRLGIAEVNQHPVARIRRHEAAEALHNLGNAVVVGGDDFAQIFGIHACRHRRQANEIGEHHRDLAACSGAVDGGRSCCRGFFGSRLFCRYG
jgi:hypothetical protein